jgi:hypothetical protein
MAHFAQLNENNIVEQVIVVFNNELLDEVGNESEQKGIDFCTNLFGGRWIQTSYNSSIRKNFAGQGYIYDAIRDAFIAPQPYSSWTLDEETCQWNAPVEYPTDNVLYIWNEETLTWDEAI